MNDVARTDFVDSEPCHEIRAERLRLVIGVMVFGTLASLAFGLAIPIYFREKFAAPF